MAPIPEISVAKMLGPTISVGVLEEYAIRTAITVVGMSVMQDVLTAKK